MRSSTAFLVICSSLAAAPSTARGQLVERVSVASDGTECNARCTAVSVSADGRVVAFASEATNLVADDFNGVSDVFVRDRSAGTTVRVSISSDGEEGDLGSYYPRLSADGRFVVFVSDATTLIDGDRIATRDVFLHELATAATTLLSVDHRFGTPAGGCGEAVLGDDGSFVAFSSTSSVLIASDNNSSSDVFRRDIAAGVTQRVSVGDTGTEGNDSSGSPALSRDGRYVAFSTYATNLDAADTNFVADVYVRDTFTGSTTLVSLGTSGVVGNGDCGAPAISDDGRYVTFASRATDLVSGADCGWWEIYVRDLVAGTTVCASVDSDGQFQDCIGGGDSFSSSLSGDGRFVVFTSGAADLVIDDTNHVPDVNCHDFGLSMTTRLSRAEDGTQADLGAWSDPECSPDGVFVAYVSSSTNLVAGDQNGVSDAFVLERRFDPATTRHYGSGWPGALGIPTLAPRGVPQLDADLQLDVSNSSGGWSVGLLLLGFSAVQWPAGFGGDLLVDPAIALLLALPPAGGVVTGHLPPDEWLTGMSLFAQVLEVDAAASKGLSSSDGLELVIGY